MRSITCILALLLSACFTGCAVQWQEYSADPVTQTVALAAAGTAGVSNVTGSVAVTPGPDAEVTVTYTKKVRIASGPFITPQTPEHYFDEVTVNITSGADGVVVQTLEPEHGFGPDAVVWVDYAVVSPPAAALSVNNITGDVNVQGITGPLAVELTTGNVTCDGAGQTQVQLTTGKATLTGTTGPLTATLVTGSLTCSGLTSSSDATVTTGNVSLEYAQAPEPTDHIDCGVVTGNLDLTLPAASAFTVDAQTVTGGIVVSGFSLTPQASGVGATLTGQVNAGGTAVSLDVTTGSIHLTAN